MRGLVALCLAVVSAPAVAGEVKAFMPKNDLAFEDNLLAPAGITQAQFNAVIASAEAIYKPLFKERFGATLTIERKWNDSTVNAYAEQPSARQWKVTMFGGLARRPEVTSDGFALVLCHEIGHHLAGYPFVSTWAANEGQSDYFATAVCAQKVLAATRSREAVKEAAGELPASVRAKCDGAYPSTTKRQTCYRAVAGGRSLAELLGGGAGSVDLERTDRRVVTRTNNEHPAAQCRLDTYVAGALCGNAKWDDGLIPGKRFAQRGSKAAQDEAFAKSCTDGSRARPRCWFAAVR